jgi:hypothetical protein
VSTQRVIFRIEYWRGVWRVTRDDKFFGDYRTQPQAQTAAEEGVQKLRAAGRDAQVALA